MKIAQIHGISTLRGEFGNWLLSLLYLSQVSTGSFMSRHAIALKATNLSPSGLVGAPFAPWILWNLWLARNKLIFEGKAYSVVYTLSKATKEAKYWEAANVETCQPAKPKKTPPLTPRLSSPACWTNGAWETA